MSNIRDLVAGYYQAIDRSDVESIVRLFALDAVYDRAGVEYRHMPEIRKFFSEDRQMSGAHIITSLWSDDKTRSVFVTGRFEGKTAAGDAHSFGFADVWRFNAAGLVSKRESYLALGPARTAR